MTQLVATGDMPWMRTGRRVHGAPGVWGPDPAWLRCLLDRSCLPGQPVWRLVSTSLRGAGRRPWTGTSTAAGPDHVPIGVPAVLTIAVVVLVMGALVAAFWMRHRMRPAVRPGPAGELPATPSVRAAVQQARIYLWQEFDAIAGLVAAQPGDSPVFDAVPLLRDRVGIAAHGTDRQLATVLQSEAGEPVLYDCSWQSVRVVSAAVQLRAALSAAAGRAVDAERVATAMVAVETAVDDLYVFVSAALPPRSGPALGSR